MRLYAKADQSLKVDDTLPIARDALYHQPPPEPPPPWHVAEADVVIHTTPALAPPA